MFYVIDSPLTKGTRTWEVVGLVGIAEKPVHHAHSYTKELTYLSSDSTIADELRCVFLYQLTNHCK
jgi:hypothetical protein